MKKAVQVWTLDELVIANKVKLGRGNIISKKDIANFPGEYPIYSSAREKNGTFGYYGKYMFDEELITWSIDGGGRLFYRPRHKFSVTNVGGTLRVLDPDFLDCRYLHLALTHLHSRISFDWVYKAHPSVIRMVYNEIPVPSLETQLEIVEKLYSAFDEIVLLERNLDTSLENANELQQSFLRASFPKAGAVLQPIGSDKSSVSDVKLVSLGEVCTVVNGGTPDTKVREFWGGPHAWITPAEMGNLSSSYLASSRRTLTNEGLRNSSAQLLPKNSVIMSSRAPIGHLVINQIPMASNQGCKGIVPSAELNFKFCIIFCLQIRNI